MKIPSRAKHVFKGILFDVFQWKQRTYNGSEKTYEGLRRPDGAVILPLDSDGKIYYGRQKQPRKKVFYGLIGGAVEKDETPLQAAKRELEEESGLSSKKWSKLFTWKIAGNIDMNIHYFIAKNCVLGGKKNEDPGERIKLLKSSIDFFFEEIVSDETFRDRGLRSYLYSTLTKAKAKELKELLLS